MLVWNNLTNLCCIRTIAMLLLLPFLLLPLDLLLLHKLWDYRHKPPTTFMEFQVLFLHSWTIEWPWALCLNGVIIWIVSIRRTYAFLFVTIPKSPYCFFGQSHSHLLPSITCCFPFPNVRYILPHLEKWRDNMADSWSEEAKLKEFSNPLDECVAAAGQPPASLSSTGIWGPGCCFSYDDCLSLCKREKSFLTRKSLK